MGPRLLIFFDRRLDREKLQVAVVVVMVACVILSAGGMYMLKHPIRPSGISDGHVRWLDSFIPLSFFLLAFLWPAIAGVILCYLFSKIDLLGSHWWIAASGSVPVAFLSF